MIHTIDIIATMSTSALQKRRQQNDISLDCGPGSAGRETFEKENKLINAELDRRLKRDEAIGAMALREQKWNETLIDWQEFDNAGHCGLCADTGIVNTLGIKAPTGDGKQCGIRTFCICPNGRKLKEVKADLQRWPDGRSNHDRTMAKPPHESARHIAYVEADFESFPRGGSCRMAVCLCGWKGPERATLEIAADDALEHEHEQGKARR